MKLHTAKILAFAIPVIAFVLILAQPINAGNPDPRDRKGDATELGSPKLPDEVSFNAHIRPIMSNTCFTCHGPDEEENHSDLRLDSYEGATESAIVPGDSSGSDVYLRIIDTVDPMPPADFRHQLSDYEKSLFEKWIDQGGQYQQHWSYAPIVRPSVPEIEPAPAKGKTNKQVDRIQKSASVIDSFIQRRLSIEGLSPSRAADRPTLLRRLSLDLIGLPPTPEEIENFVEDKSKDAWEKQVERLLASSHYGERMASQWLDIVRFSDTVGYHGDQNQNNFAYRDYVIESLNNNKPFDQFTIEQLAGDLLENPTEEQLVATGLVRLNMMTREGGAQPGEYLAKYTADRVRMLGTAWLGSTTGCCECHNHKYDPFTAKDFYSLGAYFDDLRQWGVYSDYGYTPNPDLAGFNNQAPFPPEIRFKSRSLVNQIVFLETELERATALIHGSNDKEEDETVAAWFDNITKTLPSADNSFRSIANVQATSNPPEAALTATEDGEVLPSGPAIKDQTFTVTALHDENEPALNAFRTLRLEVLPDEANAGHVGRAGDGRFRVQLTAAIIRADESISREAPRNAKQKSDGDQPSPQEQEQVEVAFTIADRDAPISYESGRPPLFIGDVWQSGPARWQLPKDEASLPHTAYYHLKEPVQLKSGDRFVITLKSDAIGKFRLSTSPLVSFSVDEQVCSSQMADALIAHKNGSALTDAQKDAVVSAWYWATTPTDDVAKDLLPIRDAIAASRSGYAMSTIAQAIPSEKIPPARVLGRGDWQDKSGEVVMPATPHFLPGYVDEPQANESDEDESLDKSNRQTRLDLAKWLVSKENPLVARHYVNRTWKHFFGQGLSNKLDDLGSQGEWPSHPELLDWLAAEFRADWDSKKLVRIIVNSDTYRQSASIRSDLKDIDPYNRLLSQQSARRLEAEAVRDNALAISGLLNTAFIGGPSVFPYQPAGHYANIQFPNRQYHANKNALQYRRGVYMHWQRSFLHPMLVNFDAPSRDECVADRPQSNSPQQALTLLNDPTFVEAARAMAARVISETNQKGVDERLDRAFQLTLSRSPDPVEVEGLKKFYGQQFARYEQHPEEIEQLASNGHRKPEAFPSKDKQVEHAAWTQVCRVILNLHETITRY